MPEYRRAFEPGGTFYFTVVTLDRRPILCSSDAVAILRRAFADTRAGYPFTIDAAVVLPEHIHTIWTLPGGDPDFSTRWRMIKSRFSHAFVAAGGPEAAPNARRVRKAERGVWQHRFWEHVVRDEREFEALCDYIHYNPVKHGYATCPHAWPYSSFHQFVRNGRYSADWGCTCSAATKKLKEPTLPPEITGE